MIIQCPKCHSVMSKDNGYWHCSCGVMIKDMGFQAQPPVLPDCYRRCDCGNGLMFDREIPNGFQMKCIDESCGSTYPFRRRT